MNRLARNLVPAGLRKKLDKHELATDDSSDDDSNYVLDVVIIGAGWSGMAAAKELQTKQNVSNYVVLEGRDYLGGRCRTIQVDGGQDVELGSQWIHGARKANPIYHAALQARMPMKRSDLESVAVYCPNDSVLANPNAAAPGSIYQQLPPDQVEDKMDTLLEGKRGFLKYQAKRQDEDEDISLRQTADEYMAKINANAEMRAWLEYILDAEVSQEYAASLEDMSMHWWDDDVEYKGGDVSFGDQSGGYSRLFDQYVPLEVQEKVLLNSKVTSIDYTQSPHVVVTFERNNSNNKVVQHQLVARQVLITVPLGVLKANKIQFQPPLPHRKQLAISRLQVGGYNKVVLIWDEADADQLPWPKDIEWMERLTNLEKEKPGLWTEFFNAQPTSGRPTVCCFTAGRLAYQIEQFSNEELQQQALETLQKVFAPVVLPAPKHCVVTRWGHDEFAYGAYSFNNLGATPKDRKYLASPMADHRIFFAGEACHKLYFATTHGALQTGIDTAKAMVRKLSKPSSTGGASMDQLLKQSVVNDENHEVEEPSAASGKVMPSSNALRGNQSPVVAVA